MDKLCSHWKSHNDELYNHFQRMYIKQKWVHHPSTYTLWLFNIDMENGPFIDGVLVYRLKMVIFHGYVK